MLDDFQNEIKTSYFAEKGSFQSSTSTHRSQAEQSDTVLVDFHYFSRIKKIYSIRHTFPSFSPNRAISRVKNRILLLENPCIPFWLPKNRIFANGRMQTIKRSTDLKQLLRVHSLNAAKRFSRLELCA